MMNEKYLFYTKSEFIEWLNQGKEFIFDNRRYKIFFEDCDQKLFYNNGPYEDWIFHGIKLDLNCSNFEDNKVYKSYGWYSLPIPSCGIFCRYTISNDIVLITKIHNDKGFTSTYHSFDIDALVPLPEIEFVDLLEKMYG